MLRIVIGLVLLSAALTLLFRWVPVPLTPLMVIRCMEQRSDDKTIRLKHDWVPLEDISPNLQLAVVCSEDQNYLAHYGFDFAAIEKALEWNKKGKRLRGGSTISQQTAKNVFLWPGRSFVRKGLEAWFTLLIELLWSKERIMEVYLNSIEMGDGVYGAESAAQFWFHKPASRLTRDESAAIAAILPNPRTYIANPPSPYIARRKEWVKKQMTFWGNKLDYGQDDAQSDTKTNSKTRSK